jgi:hypothetical protein
MPKRAEDYRHHAKECHVLARSALTEDERKQLVVMAQTWEALAEQREAKIKAGNLGQ